MVLILLQFLLVFTFIQTSLQNEYVITIITEFHLTNPYLIGSTINISHKLMRLLSKNGHLVNIKPTMSEFPFDEKVTKNVIVFVNHKTKNFDLPKNDYHNLMLITKDDTFEETLNTISAKCQLNQKVFLLKVDVLEIYEAYTINNVVVKKMIAHIDRVTNNFRWQTGVNPYFVKRRSDFQGIILKGMVEFWGVIMNADKSYLSKAPYLANNETYEITGFTYGLFHDVLMTLQDRLNFTTLLYKRKKVSWGFINDKNGSHEGIGIIGDIYYGKADIGLAPFDMIIERAIYIDYSPQISQEFQGIYIPISNNESITFDAYLAPFTVFLWMTLAFIGL